MSFCGVCITSLSQRTPTLAWWQQVKGASAGGYWDGRCRQAQSQLALEQNYLETLTEMNPVDADPRTSCWGGPGVALGSDFQPIASLQDSRPGCLHQASKFVLSALGSGFFEPQDRGSETKASLPPPLGWLWPFLGYRGPEGHWRLVFFVEVNTSLCPVT